MRDDVELLEVAGEAYNQEAVDRGELTPVFFGSAITNFGVQLFLDRFIARAPTPAPRKALQREVAPSEPEFSGFVFKIQANMDPNHRDRIAFLRVVSGKFEKDMAVTHARTGKSLRLTRPQRLFGQERETVEEAFPGDIVGLTNPGVFGLGDTVYQGPVTSFQEVPTFAPETFATLRNLDVSKLKQFEKGVAQLCEEGLVDLFWDRRAHRREPILGAVGRLQFEVVQHRLLSEYGVKTLLEPVSFEIVRWLEGDEVAIREAYWGTNAKLIEDNKGRPVLLVSSQWTLNYLADQNSKIQFMELPTEHQSAAAR